ncbi:MAG TPA: serine/threonine protein kinase [Pyrinomonadaceae bacterium]|nr:serine/threonine protein kinase [Pyrinomonadaceae bacterium]
MRELSLNNCRLDRRYDILDQLGRGSYAEIYISRDVLASPKSPHNTVVIKALNVFLQDDLDDDLERTLVENFQNEAIALDRVRHPNIISRLGHGTARDLKGTTFHYLVLEYMPGGDLQRLCREKNLSAKKAVSYIEQVCAGLRHAHSKGVIHRDIKPHNLLLSKDLETVKIADFGVARFSASHTPITRVGTNIYAPPEHSPLLSGQTGELHCGELTFAADIYSLAKSTYTLFTCESPRFYANQPIDALPAACRTAPWAEEFLRVVRRATQNNPTERQQTIDEFWTDLAKVREIIEEAEPETVIRKINTSELPQAHVAPGYSPLAPAQARFNTSRDLHLRYPAIAGVATGIETVITHVTANPSPNGLDQRHVDYADEAASPAPTIYSEESPVAISPQPIRRNRRLRRVAVFMALILLFGGGLYGMGLYIRSTNLWATIRSSFHKQTAVANTDVNLRAEPNAGSDAIGLVTKNSKLRIVNSQNNWYQVDVIQQGRERTGSPNETHGWLNGKYIDIDDN